MMDYNDISNIIAQIENGKQDKRFVYNCCGESFPSLYGFRKHLYEYHPEELSKYFESSLHREQPLRPTKEDIHRAANKGKKKYERELKRKELRIHNKKNDSVSAPNKGDHFHLIYTPMGNKR